jgi:DNA-directed RNA polymerase III subunit RPC4
MSEPSSGRGGRGKKVVAPRGKGRRSQAEREQLSQAERERNREKALQYAQQIKAQRDAEKLVKTSGRGNRGGRGRGGYMGATPTGSGAFSAGSAIPGQSPELTLIHKA